ncbi:hypothetical protein LITTLEE_174 [Mycobacterium phage LittleE]|uniref:Uncharacterized protein n=4 Tax=Omegavirus TaxID=1623292 RepID=Q853Z1_BPMOM|nr:gp175 [Mycobacterium phage Omega]YP_009012063.1 hypothetical protein CM09_gp164 [Mycobacterium phage Courthouse]YP_009205297.1 hypothetical protein AVT17_gp167 [Mycobacterium phage Ariel]YP_009213387.1 hypothetical protein AVV70_gp170 [Mycobacterium phage MiaZeal]YP_009637085.1 hypothetical protein FGG27_gp174 [Mycobacterium phage LittleE]ASD50784.1 hypothetical protein PORCELAIN_167 [Mycobacterium phage Porcelain]ASD53556.1 hypothetical protein PBI_LUCKY2013_163 [Mycobacterium phage Lucky
MSLTDRLAARRQYATLSNNGCATCKWLDRQTEDVRMAVADWIDEGLSLTPLHEELAADGLPVGLSAFTGHVRKCHKVGPK